MTAPIEKVEEDKFIATSIGIGVLVFVLIIVLLFSICCFYRKLKRLDEFSIKTNQIYTDEGMEEQEISNS